MTNVNISNPEYIMLHSYKEVYILSLRLLQQVIHFIKVLYFKNQ